MFEFARGYFRRTVFKTIRYFKHPRRLKTRPLLRWFSTHFLDKTVWKPTRHTLAGGMAIGLFITMQLLPGQMIYAVVLAAVLRVNIPIAVIMCWISNPATFAPIAYAEKQAGEWLLNITGDPTAAWLQHVANERVVKGLEFARSMFIGGLMLGALFAPVGYVLTYFSWDLLGRSLKIQRDRRKQPDLVMHGKPGERPLR